MKKRLLHLCLILLTFVAGASASEIRGKVISHMDKAVIPEALIVLEDPQDDTFQMETMSDKEGFFMFRDVPP
ncbi:MAG: hypothetical protein XE04_1961, partial [Marinimicrobia bacterium 46_43]